MYIRRIFILEIVQKAVTFFNPDQKNQTPSSFEYNF